VAVYSGDYYNYTLSENGTPVHYGHDAADYSTDVLCGKVLQFVDQDGRSSHISPPSAPTCVNPSTKASRGLR
jgi:hypothetical protein